MTVTLSKEAELKSQVTFLKGEVARFSGQADNFSKLLGSAQDEAAKVPALQAEVASAKDALSNANAQLAQKQAEIGSLTAQAAKAEAIIAGLKSLKSLLAQV